MPDVYLLTEGQEGEVAIPHLTLTFLDSGLALQKADGEPVWDSAWAELEELSPVERSMLPDGRAGVVITVVERRPPGSPPLRAGHRRRRRHRGRSQGARRGARATDKVAAACGLAPVAGRRRAGCAGGHDGAAPLGHARHPLLGREQAQALGE